MRKKIALLLAIVMILSSLPVTVFGRVTEPSNIPTIPRGYGNNSIIVGRAGTISNFFWQTREDGVEIGYGIPVGSQRDGTGFSRNITFSTVDFTTEIGPATTSVALMSLGYGSWLGRPNNSETVGGTAFPRNGTVPHGFRAAGDDVLTALGATRHAAGTNLSAQTGNIRVAGGTTWAGNTIEGAEVYLTPEFSGLARSISGAFLGAFTSTSVDAANPAVGATITVVLVQDNEASNRDRAIAIVVAERTGVSHTTVPVPIEFATRHNSNNVRLSIDRWSGQFATSTQAFTIAERREEGRFRFTGGDIRDFSDHVDIHRIRIEELFVGAFDRSSHWRIDLTLPRGFTWARSNVNNLPNFNNSASVRGDRFEHVRTRWGTGWNGIDVSHYSRHYGAPVRGVYAQNIENNGRTLYFCVDFDGALDLGRNLEWLEIRDLRINADDNATRGDVNVEVMIRHWDPGSAGVITGGVHGGTTYEEGTERGYVRPYRGTITVGRYLPQGIVLEIHEDDDIEDFVLESGRREFGWLDITDGYARLTTPAGIGHAIRNVEGDIHATARVVLREITPRTLNLTGNANGQIEFEFPDGIQVLGVRVNPNGQFDDDTERHLWYDERISDDHWGTRIRNNLVTMRPIAETDREEQAELTMEFYLSVQAGFESIFGDEIEVTVDGRALGDHGPLNAVVAYAWDPIFVETSPVLVDDVGAAAFGRILRVPIQDIVIHETSEEALRAGTELWIGVETHGAPSSNPNVEVSLTAMSVTSDNLRVSARPVPGHGGVWVTILGESRDEPGSITLSGVEIYGAIVPGGEYNVIVGGDAVAHNWGIAGMGWGSGAAVWTGADRSRGLAYGIFSQVPYSTHAFTFEGTDIGGIPGITGPQTPTPTPTITPTPTPTIIPTSVEISENMQTFPSRQTPGYEFRGVPLVFVPNIQNANYVTGYVMMMLVADILGVQGTWDPASATGTFTDGVNTVVFENGSDHAMVNGVRTPIMSGNLRADARILSPVPGEYRFFVPIAFFEHLPFGASVNWIPGRPTGQRAITVTPR